MKVSVRAGKRCSLPRCLKSLFAPCKGFASWSKKNLHPTGSIFFAQPLHGVPRFVFTAHLKVPGAQAKALAPNPLPCSRVN